MTDISSPPLRTLSHITDWVFDLDNTLYSAGSRLFDQVDRRMGEFIARHFAIDAAAARGEGVGAASALLGVSLAA